MKDARAIQAPLEVSSNERIVIFRPAFESFQWPLHPWAMRVPTKLWFGPYNLLLFVSLSPSIFESSPLIFQNRHSICFSFNFVSCFFLLQFILFEIIYKIRIVFQFHPPFDCYFLFSILFLIYFIF
jgi:hypothetical protein